MKTSALSLAIAISSALALTACGGGGSSGGSTAKPSTPVVKPTTNPTNPNQATNNNTGNNKPTTNNNTTPNNSNLNTGNNKPNTSTQAQSKISGKTVFVDGNNEIFYKDIESDDINTLTVDGRSFNIGSSGISSGGFTTTNTGKRWSVVSGTHMKYAKYGFYNDNSGEELDYYFYQGVKTPVANIPTTGTAHYTGRSIYTCETCGNQMTQGTSKFSVDFDKKNVTGSISNGIASNLSLSATISGNTFSGKNEAGTQTHGAFFGDKAQELSGYYTNEGRDFAGVFGATKQ